MNQEPESDTPKDFNPMTEKRKRGRPAGSGKGRTMKTFSVNMREDQIHKLDRISDKNRSSWLRDRVDEARDKLKGKKL
jgi:hypothetical protein